jgi:hypothetical protein
MEPTGKQTPPGFSRVVLQFQPIGAAGSSSLFDTTDFSRVEFQFWPSSTIQG